MIFLLYHNADIFVDYLLKVIFYRCYPLILVCSGKIKSGGIYVIEQRFSIVDLLRLVGDLTWGSLVLFYLYL